MARMTTVKDMPNQSMFVAFCGSLRLVKVQAMTPPTHGSVPTKGQIMGRSHQTQETCSCERNSFPPPVSAAPHS